MKKSPRPDRPKPPCAFHNKPGCKACASSTAAPPAIPPCPGCGSRLPDVDLAHNRTCKKCRANGVSAPTLF